MANAYSYSFSKRHNSTAQPTGGTLIDVQLKGGCDILAPVFILNYSGVPAFNYMLFEGRYYFVTGVKSVRQDLFEVSCAVDVLASWKPSIQASSQYVLYYTHANTEIADRRLTPKTTQSTNSASGSFGFLGKNHCFILTVIGEDETASFAVTPSQIRDLYGTGAGSYVDRYEASINDLMVQSPVTGNDVKEVIIDFARWICDYLKTSAGAFNYAGTVSENIKSCIILPVAAGAIGGTPNVNIKVGAILTGVNAFRIADRYITDTATVSIPWQASDWRRLDPYHEIYLYIPALGLISLSASDLVGESSLTVKMTMDTLSGDAIFEVKSSTKCVYYANTNLATGYALGSSQTNPAGAMNALIGVVGAAMGNPAAALGGALGVANSLKPTPTCIGSNSGGAILGIGADVVTCYTVFHDTNVTPASVSAVKGTPYNGVMSLSGVAGYVQCMDASVAGSMTDTEREQVNELLNGGVYIE